MKHKVFTTYDSKVGAYLQPFVMRSRGEAMRAFESICNDGKSQFCLHPDDFTLFEIGEYDELSGNIVPHEAKISLGLALDFIKSVNKPSVDVLADTVKLVK